MDAPATVPEASLRDLGLVLKPKPGAVKPT
jgi:hypothetical protein